MSFLKKAFGLALGTVMVAVPGPRGETLAPTSVVAAVQPSRKPLLAIIRPPSRHPVLVRLDPLSLEPIGPQVEVGEYHYAWSISPDGSQLALATGGPPGSFRIVDLERMAVVRDVRLGIAAEALGWLTPNRLVAVLQRGGTVVADPTTGEVVHRHSVPASLDSHSGPQPAARTRSGLVVRMATDRREPTMLALAAADGSLRTVSLDEIQAGPGETGFAVDPVRPRAFIAAARRPVAEVDLETMQVRYRRLTGRSPLEPPCGGEAQGGSQATTRCSSRRRLLWLGDERLAVFGADLTGSALNRPGRLIPAGVALVDTRRWTVRMIDSSGSQAILAGTTLLVFGGERRPSPKGVGLRAYRLDGRQRFHLFGDEYVYAVRVASGYAYALTGDDAIHIVDLRTGGIVRDLNPSWTWIDLIEEPNRLGA